MGGGGAQIGGGGVGEGATALQMAVGGGGRKGGGATDGWSSGAELERAGGGRSVLERAGQGRRFGGENGGGRGRKEDRAAKTCGRGAGCKENRMGGLVLQRKITLVTDVWAFEHLGLQVSRLFYLIRRTTR
jgi:hypothetical protein